MFRILDVPKKSPEPAVFQTGPHGRLTLQQSQFDDELAEVALGALHFWIFRVDTLCQSWQDYPREKETCRWENNL